MRNGWLLATACLCAAATAFCQRPDGQPARVPDGHEAACPCGVRPAGPEQEWTAQPYAGEPADMSPYSRFASPYSLNYLQPTVWLGPGRNTPDPKDITEVRIGFVGPIASQDPDYIFGMRILHGAQLAVEEANARGGYGGKPFRLMLHDDYNNWQEKAVAGNDRPTDPDIWGSASDAAVKAIYDDKDWAIFGSISSESTHIMLRIALKAEIPIVNSASTDPTIPETSIPWFFTVLQDDRVQSFTLARRIYTELGLKRAAILRINNRYGRMGVPKFRDASRRLGHPVVIEQKFGPGDTDFSRQLRVIQESRADAIVIWSDEIPAAMILKQMRALGMKQRVFGSYRTLGSELLAQAGSAAEGFEAVFPYDPSRTDPRWLGFNGRFEARFQQKPEQFASLAYDAMNVLLGAICNAGLNRVRIQDALDHVGQYDGVTGHMVFDPNQKNVSPLYLGTVHDGVITYRAAVMSKSQASLSESATPYARVGEDGVGLAGERESRTDSGPPRVIVFGPGALRAAQSWQMKAVLRAAQLRHTWTLVPIESGQNWGVAATQLVHALMDEHAVAIVALDRDSAHLAEQMALKSFVPVVALADDRSLTSADIPWIFRLPARTAPEAALRLITEAGARSADPEQIRAALASGRMIAGVAFAPTGEVRGQ